MSLDVVVFHLTIILNVFIFSVIKGLCCLISSCITHFCIESLLLNRSHLYELLIVIIAPCALPLQVSGHILMYLNTYTLNCCKIIRCLFNVLYKCINRSLVFLSLTFSHSVLPSCLPFQVSERGPSHKTVSLAH